MFSCVVPKGTLFIDFNKKKTVHLISTVFPFKIFIEKVGHWAKKGKKIIEKLLNASFCHYSLLVYFSLDFSLDFSIFTAVIVWRFFCFEINEARKQFMKNKEG
jgi:hypothetical protein